MATHTAARPDIQMLERLNQPISLPKLTLPKPRRGAAPRVAGGRTAKNLTGLDIDPGQIVAAQVSVNGRLEVVRAAGMPMPPDVVRDGEVTDIDALASGLRELFESAKLDRRVRIGLANQRLVVRRIELPPIDDPRELATAVRFQAQDEIPMPLESVSLDFVSLGVTETPAGPRQQVVLVAARLDTVERVLEAARAAGLRPEGIDVSAFAMIRALHPRGGASTERVLYLAVGGLTNLAVAEGPTCHFSRVLGGGLEQIVADVAERTRLPIGEARSLVRSGVLEAEAVDVDVHDNAQLARAALGEGLRRIAADVRNSLDFHRSQEGGQPVTRAVLCGAALDVPGFVDALSAELGIPVSPGLVQAAGGALVGDLPASRLTIAAGLATAGVDA